MKKSPVIVYVDDEPMQHIAMENLIPEDWVLHCFDNPLEALGKIKDCDPAIIISDQRMPQMQGFRFLETARQICPDAIRIITTGYNDEHSIVESIRSAKIFDYIVKPWDIEKLMQSLERASDYYSSENDRRSLAFDLQRKNEVLNFTLKDLEIMLRKYEDARSELKSWVHPFVIKATEEKIIFPFQKDITLFVVDIIDSGKLHDLSVGSVDLRALVLQSAWETVLKHGGEIESQEGDKVYANFGLSGSTQNISNAALAAAKEFRSSLQAINDHYGVVIEAGISIHYAENCKINLRQSAINTASGIIIRKKFDTSSADVDLCHRAESLMHRLPGSNIVLTEAIKARITAESTNFIALGEYLLKGQTRPQSFYIIKSFKVTDKEIFDLKAFLNNSFQTKSAG